MISALAAAVLLIGSFDAGGHVAGVFPVAGAGRNHSSSARVGCCLGYSTGPVRLAAGYDYTSLPGLQGSPYRFALHQVSLSCGYQFLRQSDWGIEVLGGGGYGFAERSFETGREKGSVGTGLLGIGFVQNVGKSRLSIGVLDNLLLENGQGGFTRLVVNQILSVRAGVAYVF